MATFVIPFWQASEARHRHGCFRLWNTADGNRGK